MQLRTTFWKGYRRKAHRERKEKLAPIIERESDEPVDEFLDDEAVPGYEDVRHIKANGPDQYHEPPCDVGMVLGPESAKAPMTMTLMTTT